MNTNHTLLNFISASLFDRPVRLCSDESELAAVYGVAQKNAVANVVHSGIKKAGSSMSPALETSYRAETDKALFLYAMQSQQVSELSKLFEQAQIPFVLLKGTRMREFYPSPELRTSSDIDILARADDKTLIDLMQNAGFTFEKDGGTTLNFRYGAAIEVELHRHLFDKKMSFHGYFDTIWERVIRKDGWSYQYVLSEEDFYANMLAHFAKHFSRYGCGIRNAVDIAVYLHNPPAAFNREKADGVLEQIGLLQFERRLRQLISAWNEDTWSESDNMLTQYILGCGVFGTKVTRSTHKITYSAGKTGKTKEFWQHIFPNLSIMRRMYSCLRKCPILLPACWAARLLRLVISDRPRIRKTMRQLSKIDKNSLDKTEFVLQEMHLDHVTTV